MLITTNVNKVLFYQKRFLLSFTGGQKNRTIVIDSLFKLHFPWFSSSTYNSLRHTEMPICSPNLVTF